MSGFVPFGQNLQLQSGVPLLKVGTVFAEKLSITKRADGGNMGGLMQSVLANGNLSSVMQNPMSGLLSGLQGQIGSLVGQLQGMGGGGGSGGGAGGESGSGTDAPDPGILITALNNLAAALAALQASGDNLAGLTNGATGFYAMLGHVNTVDMVGPAMPAQYGLSVVARPLACADVLQALFSEMTAAVAAVLAGTLSPEDAAAIIAQDIARINAIIAGSSGALVWGDQMHPTLALAATVAGVLAAPPVPTSTSTRAFQAVLSTLVVPAARGAMEAAVAAQIAHEQHDPIDVDAMTSLED